MTRSRLTTYLIRSVVFFGFVCSGWFAWFAAQSLVEHFELDFRVREAGFGFISSAALLISVVGVYNLLALGGIFGIFAAAWITRRRVS